MTDIYGNHLRRWSLDVATGAIGCFADAVDLRATPADDVAAIEAHNALMHETVASLDDYEGGGFRRRKSTVRADGIDHADAWVYTYIGPTHALSAIATGDYGPPVHRARP